MARALPAAVLAAVVLLAGVYLAYTGLVAREDADQQKMKIAMCGTAGDRFLQMGVTALQTLDDTRFAVEITEMEEPAAREALSKGEIAAYVVVPDGFLEAAMYGKIYPLQYVTLAEAGGLSALFQEETTRVIGDVLLAAQQGTYGAGQALAANGMPEEVNAALNDIAFHYVELALQRGNGYSLKLLGVGSGLTMDKYLLSGFAVLLLLLLALPFAPVCITSDYALGKVLAAKGCAAWQQVLAEFFAFFTMLALLAALLLTGMSMAGFQSFGWECLPVLLLTASLSFFVYSLSTELIGGVVLQAFTVVGLCFVSGCIYPVFFFPQKLQQAVAFLPTGAAREYLALCLTGDVSASAVAAVVGYSAVLLSASCLLRRYRLGGRRR